MSQVLWIKAEDSPEDTLCDDLWALLHFGDAIDSICDEKGVERLSKFHDTSEAAAEFDIELEPNLSDPPALLKTLLAVETSIKPGDAGFCESDQDRTSDVLDDLKIAVQVTRECDQRGKKVRLILVS
jgi:hypothetical protein